MRLLTIIFVFTFALGRSQHNPDYTQYMFNGVLLNPAFAGAHNALNVTALYGHQWVKMEGAPVSKSFSAHSPLKNKKISVGLLFENDRFAIFDHNRLTAMYAYRIKILNGKLAFGLSAGADIYTSNWNRIVTTTANDPRFSEGAVRNIVPVFGGGLYFENKKLSLGISAPQLFYGAMSAYQTLVATAGMLQRLGNDISVKPAALFKYMYSTRPVINVSSTFYYKDIIGLGGGYTSNSSFIALIDVRLNDQLHFGYGYSQLSNKLNTYSGGSHEAMLRYTFSYKVKSMSPRYFY